METQKKKIEYIGENSKTEIEAEVYNVKGIDELKENTLFGILTSTNNVYKISNLNLPVNYKSVDLTEVFGDKEVPLIFKKLKGNIAVEFLSEKKLTILSIEDLYKEKELNKKLDNNIVIDPSVNEFGSRTNNIFVIDDNYKDLFIRETLPIRSKIEKGFEILTNKSNKEYKVILNNQNEYSSKLERLEKIINNYESNIEEEKKTHIR